MQVLTKEKLSIDFNLFWLFLKIFCVNFKASHSTQMTQSELVFFNNEKQTTALTKVLKHLKVFFTILLRK